MKKIFVLLVALLILTSAFAKEDPTSTHGNWAIGVQGGFLNGLGCGSITLKVPKIPLVFAVDAGGGSGDFLIGITGDYWLQNPQLNRFFYWYYGPGGAVSLTLGDDFGVFVGPRFVIGIELFPAKIFEIYLQAAAQIGLGIYDGGVGMGWGIPLSGGFRFWL